MMMIYYSIQSLIIDISTCTDCSWSLDHPFHLHGELFLWFTVLLRMALKIFSRSTFFVLKVMIVGVHRRTGEKVPKTISNACKEKSCWINIIDSIHEDWTGTLSPLVMACRMCQVIDKINLTKTIGGLNGDDIPLGPFGTSLGSDTAWSCYTKTFIRKGPSWLVMNGALEVRSTTLVTVWVCFVEKLGSKSEKTARLENVPELFELLRWSSCLWDIEWQHVPYQTSNFWKRVNSSAFFALGQCLWPLSGPCELFDALGMQYPGQTPAPGWNSFGPISPPRPTQPTAPAQHVLQQPKGHVLQNLAVNWDSKTFCNPQHSDSYE